MDARLSERRIDYVHTLSPTECVGRQSKADRLFNPNGRRHFRKNYDLRELPVGLLILAGLVAIGGWAALFRSRRRF
ncbi:MAG: hypothetical protein AAFV29_22795, partial [Myxococcota bacterium]